MTSKISLALSCALAIAVCYLLFKDSSPASTASAEGGGMQLPASSAFADTAKRRAPVIAYIHGDSIMAHYDFFLEKKDAIEAKMKSSEGKLKKEMASAQKEYEELMTYAQSKGDKLPDDEAATIQNRIMQLEYKMQELQAEEEENLYKRQDEVNKELMERIQQYLKSYAASKGIDMVLNYQQLAQIILFAGEPFDITADVVNGLNEAYRAEKEK